MSLRDVEPVFRFQLIPLYFVPNHLSENPTDLPLTQETVSRRDV